MRKDQLKNTLKKIPGVDRLLGLVFRSRREAAPVPAPEGAATSPRTPEGAAPSAATHPEGVPSRPPGLERRRASRKSAPPPPAAPATRGAPDSAAGSRLVLMVVDPFSAFAYWEVPPRALERGRSWLGDSGAGIVLRVQELTGIGPHARPTGETFDVQVAGASGSHYVNVWTSGKSLVAELGLRSAAGTFLPLVGSNEIELPTNVETTFYDESERPLSRSVDPRWRPRGVVETAASVTFGEESTPAAEAAVSVEDFETVPLYARPGARQSAGVAGTRQGSGPLELPPEWKLQFGFSSAELASGGRPGGPVSSLELQRRQARAELVVDAARDTIVRGRAQPGTDLVIGGVRVPVQPDGSFDLRLQPRGDDRGGVLAEAEEAARELSSGLSLHETSA